MRHWFLERIGEGASSILVCALAVGVANSTSAVAATGEHLELVKPISEKLNSSGRAITMAVPIRDDMQPIGEIVLRINADDSVLIPKAALVDKLTSVLDAETLARLHGAGASGGQLSIADLRAAGFDVRFDPGLLELVFLPTPEQRPSGDLSLTGHRSPRMSANALSPALFSGYLNLIGSADRVWARDDVDSQTSGRLDAESVFRMYGIVIENELSIEGDLDMVCPVSAWCNYEHSPGLRRQSSRLVYDMPDNLLRLQVGDANTEGTGIQRSPDILGVTLEKSPRKLRPNESIRPTGRSSFRIERSSEIQVVVNGAVVGRLRLRPGNYNLSDLPLATGANEVELRITDDSGEERTLAFTAFFDGSLLATGKDEWSVSAGVPSYFRDNERSYRSDEYFGSGFYRYGLTEEVTVEGHLQADNEVAMGGASVFTATAWGFFGIEAAASTGDFGSGWAADVSWDVVDFHGLAASLGGLSETVRFGAEYRSTDFRAPGEFLETASGILYPQYDYWLRLAGTYSVQFDAGVMAVLSGRYQFSDHEVLDLSYPYTLRGDRYGVDLTLSSPITSNMNGSLGIGYSNETYLLTDRDDREDQEDGDFRVMARLSVRPYENTRVSTSYDTLNREATVSAYSTFGHGLDSWETSVDAQTRARGDEETTAGASVSYYGNRAEVTAQHTSSMNGLAWGGFDMDDTTQRSTVRVGTSIAFADGKAGVGRPIRGEGFAVVAPHESIAGKEITVGTADDVRARADFFGPAVVPDLPAYSNSTVPVDVEDLPIGYSLGAGALETYAPYRAGYALEVGSAYSVSVFGILIGSDGEPLALLAGTASPAGSPDKQVPLFTNSVGKFAAEGLSPGRWTIEMPSEGAPTRYALDIPQGVDGLFKAGTLTPLN